MRTAMVGLPVARMVRGSMLTTARVLMQGTERLLQHCSWPSFEWVPLKTTSIPYRLTLEAAGVRRSSCLAGSDRSDQRCTRSPPRLLPLLLLLSAQTL